MKYYMNAILYGVMLVIDSSSSCRVDNSKEIVRVENGRQQPVGEDPVFDSISSSP